MTPLKVGVIGAGAMGSDHVRTITTSVPAARVAAVYDLDSDRAEAAAAPARATVLPSADDLIADVDAVLIASPDFTHADLVLSCLRAGRPVLCEKPLAVTASDARKVLDAETALGRRLVQVGFMRRYDPGFVDLRRALTSGSIGEVRLVHAVHRNASNATSTDDAGLITGSMVHELDMIPWLVSSEITAIRVESPVRHGFRDPQLATVWTRDGAMASVEVFVNAGYGYDVRCEAVGTLGTVSLGHLRFCLLADRRGGGPRGAQRLRRPLRRRVSRRTGCLGARGRFRHRHRAERLGRLRGSGGRRSRGSLAGLGADRDC
jgi:myo-inositol 2-dehydrogenase / D-chiro-inositol 1-dehydrogenase